MALTELRNIGRAPRRRGEPIRYRVARRGRHVCRRRAQPALPLPHRDSTFSSPQQGRGVARTEVFASRTLPRPPGGFDSIRAAAWQDGADVGYIRGRRLRRELRRQQLGCVYALGRVVTAYTYNIRHGWTRRTHAPSVARCVSLARYILGLIPKFVHFGRETAQKRLSNG